jgi:formylglycine-generating enzyme required for sulfatase activity
MFASLPLAVIGSLPPIRTSIGIELKLIPPGTFTMGQAGGDKDETPHEVTLTKPFYMGVYEVTNAQWKRVMGSEPSNWKDDDRPVEQVSWDDANEFCRRLSALPEEKRAGRVYRLPTEAEWEYACRAGTTTKWSFGDDESGLGDYAWFGGNSGSQTHPVGKKKPNAWGLFDMHGNVWEWCSDWSGDYAKGAVTDPQGPSGGSLRVNRGGSWRRTAGNCRSAFRGRYAPSLRFVSLGFRLALSPSGEPAVPPEAAIEN